VEREESSRMTMMMLRIPPTRRIMKDTWIERVKSVLPDGTASAEWTLDRAQYKRPSDKGDYSYDSAGDEPNAEARPIANIVGRVSPRSHPRPGGPRAVATAPPLPPATTQVSVDPPASSPSSGPAAQNTSPPMPSPGAMPQYDETELKSLLLRVFTGFLPAN